MRKSSFCLIYLLTIILTGFSQTKEKSISISFTNNGIIYDLVDDFYFGNSGYDPNEALFYNELKFKLDIKTELLLKNNFFISNKVGFGTRKDKYTIDAFGSEGITKQNYYEISIGLHYQFNIDKFKIINGFNVPLYFISSQKNTTDYKNPNDNILSHSSVIEGGLSTGLLNSTSLKYQISNKMFILTSFAFGVVYSNFGGSSHGKNEYENSNIPDESYKMNSARYRTLGVSKPEISLGIGANF